jgi:small-conductance mechanosensitive channel
MGIEKAGFHLFGALFRNIGKVILSFIIFLIIGFIVMEAVGYFLTTPHQLTTLGHIVAVLFGLAIGYAAALTVIAREAIHALVAAVRTVEGDVQGEMSGAGKMLQAVEQAISKGR